MGRSSGIGKDVAIAQIQNGASVTIASSNQAKFDAAVNTLKNHVQNQNGVTVFGEAVDMKDSAVLTRFLTKETPFDHLVMTAGESAASFVGGIKPDVDIRDQRKSCGTCSQPHPQDTLLHPGGFVTVTTGVLRRRPIPGVGSVIGVAGAIETATHGQAVDLKPIRVNTM
ncbi:short chain dehydrogenase [Ceratobasidium sp. AG-Ba]|nr:short chain dehydrogenase [Ceratobasidium sp. AG-Ba]QRW11560.1 short chain dehydrogenase [Ceratobasidium sp. AG-Ba]